MKSQNVIRLALVLIIASFVLSTCTAAPTATPAETRPAVVKQTDTVPPETVPTKPVPSKPVETTKLVFASWVEDDYEQWALATLVDQFSKSNPQYQIELDFTR